jgi:hypothetical protein
MTMGPHQSASAVLAAAAAAGRGSAMAEGEKRGCQEPCCRRCRRLWRMLMAALWWRFQRRWSPHVALLQRRMPGTGHSLWWATTSSPPFLCSPRARGGGGGCVVSTARVRCGSGAAGPWQREQVLVVAYLAGVHTTRSVAAPVVVAAASQWATRAGARATRAPGPPRAAAASSGHHRAPPLCPRRCALAPEPHSHTA